MRKNGWTVLVLIFIGCANYGHLESRLDRAGEYTDRVSVSDHFQVTPKLFLEAAPNDFKIENGKINYDETKYKFLGKIVVDVKGNIEILEDDNGNTYEYTTAGRKEKMMKKAISEAKKIDATHLIYGNFYDRDYTVTSSSASVVVPIKGLAVANGNSTSQNVVDEGVRFTCYAFREITVEKALLEKESEYQRDH